MPPTWVMEDGDRGGVHSHRGLLFAKPAWDQTRSVPLPNDDTHSDPPRAGPHWPVDPQQHSRSAQDSTCNKHRWRSSKAIPRSTPSCNRAAVRDHASRGQTLRWLQELTTTAHAIWPHRRTLALRPFNVDHSDDEIRGWLSSLPADAYVYDLRTQTIARGWPYGVAGDLIPTVSGLWAPATARASIADVMKTSQPSKP